MEEVSIEILELYKKFLNKENLTIKELNLIFKSFTFNDGINLDLEIIDGLIFPKRIQGGVFLTSKEIKNVKFKYVEGGIYANNAVFVKNVDFGENTIGNISLIKAEKLVNVIFPKEIRKGSLLLSNVMAAENVKLPNLVRKDIDMSGLIKSKNIKMPNFVGGNFYINDSVISRVRK